MSVILNELKHPKTETTIFWSQDHITGRLECRLQRMGLVVKKAAFVAAHSVARDKITVSCADQLRNSVADTAGDQKKG